MLRNLICIIFATCILYAVPAQAISTKQLESRLNQYIENTVVEAIIRDCKNYNVQPPKGIKARVTLEGGCGVVLIIKGSGDPRVVANVADMIMEKTYDILISLGLSKKKMQQTNYLIFVRPATLNREGKWIMYDAPMLYWEDGIRKIIRIPADKLQIDADQTLNK